MAEAAILQGVLVLARVAALIGFCPLFGGRQLPVQLKIGLAVALTAFWIGTAPADGLPEKVPALLAVLLISKEIAIGLLLAMLVGMLLVPARIAGSYIGQEIGISMEPVTHSGTDPSTIMASVFETFAILMFFGLNLHHFLVLFLHYSLTAVTGPIELTQLPTAAWVDLVNRLPEYGLLIAAPIAVLGFVMVVSLYFLSKAAPTLNLFSVGMPLRVGLGVLSLVIFLPVIWQSIESYFYRMLGEFEQFMSWF